MKSMLLFGLLLFAVPVGMAEDVSLRDYVDMRLDEQDKRIQQDRDSSQLAVSIAQTATNERLAILNEYKGLAADKDATFATREGLDALETSMNQQITSLEEATNRRLAAIEKDRERVYGAIAVVGLMGISSMIKLFWPGRV